MIGIIGLGGCATIGSDRATPAEEVVPEGSTLEVVKPLKRLGNSRRIYIQAGERTTPSSRSRYAAYCSFRLRPADDGAVPERIRPGQFETGVPRHSVNTLGQHTRGDLQVAATGSLHRLASGRGGGSYSAFEYATVIPLQSDDQRGVYELVCAHFRDPNDFSQSHYLTRSEIESTLEGVAELANP